MSETNKIYSMTGFGRAEASMKTEIISRKVTVEMKSVNHRYADINIKMPRRFYSIEQEMRNILKKYVTRGKVDVFVAFEDIGESNVCVNYNKTLAADYVKNIKEIATDFELGYDLQAKLDPTVIARFPEVFSLEEKKDDDDSVNQLVFEAVEAAGKAFMEARAIEGDNLRRDIIDKIDSIKVSVDKIEEISPQIIADYKAKLKEKVTDLLEDNNIDETRLAMEVTLFADKICVDEEMVRLKSHVDTVRNILVAGGECGRKLDFIVQEMNREANTTLSKAGSLAVTDIGISLKTDIEKIREQIQNLE